MHKKKIVIALDFISSVALLPAGLDSTPTKSLQLKNISLLLVSLDNTPTKFLSSPLCIGIISLFSPFISFLIF